MTYCPSSRTWSSNHSSKPKVLLLCKWSLLVIGLYSHVILSLCVLRNVMQWWTVLSSFFHPRFYFWTLWPIYSVVNCRAVRIWWLIRFSYGKKRGKEVKRVIACTDGTEEIQRIKNKGQKDHFSNTWCLVAMKSLKTREIAKEKTTIEISRFQLVETFNVSWLINVAKHPFLMNTNLL